MFALGRGGSELQCYSVVVPEAVPVPSVREGSSLHQRDTHKFFSVFCLPCHPVSYLACDFLSCSMQQLVLRCMFCLLLLLFHRRLAEPLGHNLLQRDFILKYISVITFEFTRLMSLIMNLPPDMGPYGLPNHNGPVLYLIFTLRLSTNSL